MATLATFGGRLLEVGLPGQIANLEECSIDSKSNLEASAGIDFGNIVAASGDGCKIPSATTDRFLGISVRMPGIGPANSSGELLYEKGKTVPICYLGDIYVKAAENVTAGDQVICKTNVTTGSNVGGSTSGIVGANRAALPNAIWLDTVAIGGVGRVRLAGVILPKTTS